MSKNKLIIFTALAILIVLAPWFTYFGEAEISNESENWAYFSTYISGILTPIFAFGSLILLLDTVKLQNKANKDLSDQTQLTRKLSLQTSFENLFFNLLATQSDNFKNFKAYRVEEGEKLTFESSAAVERLLVELERQDDLEEINEEERIDNKTEIVKEFNENKQIFNIVRTFSNLQEQIHLSLRDDSGFTTYDRRRFYISLINLTSFHILMLLMIKIKYLPCNKTKAIQENEQIMEIFSEVNLLAFKDRI